MKNYGALKTIAFIMKLIGWLTIAFAVVGFVVGLMHNPYNYSGAGVVTGLVGFYSLAAVISGIVSIASGEAIAALIDIAQNSAKIEQNSARTVEFFARMEANKGASNSESMRATR